MSNILMSCTKNYFLARKVEVLGIYNWNELEQNFLFPNFGIRKLSGGLEKGLLK
jgi:hypothetical protein